MGWKNGKYLPELLLGLTTCAIGVCGSALIRDENRKKICLISGIIAFVLAILYLSNLYIGIRNDEAAKETRATMFQSICQQYFAREDYSRAVDTLLKYGAEDAASCMIYAYFLANGYGVEKNIPLSIQYYTIAKNMGEPRAETNMVVSVIRNCPSKEKIVVLKDAYQAGNEMAIQYIDYVVQSWNSNPETMKAPLSTESIWDLDEKDLLTVLNGPFFFWVCSNKTYTTAMSTTSTPTFTRRYLYMLGTNRVYEECSLIVNDSFPDWLQEDIW